MFQQDTHVALKMGFSSEMCALTSSISSFEKKLKTHFNTCYFTFWKSVVELVEP
jgi:hypothetical protein